MNCLLTDGWKTGPWHNMSVFFFQKQAYKNKAIYSEFSTYAAVCWSDSVDSGGFAGSSL